MSDLGSLAFYLASFVSAAGLLYLGLHYSKKIFVLLALAVPILVGGLRYYVGTDYASYERLFNAFLNLSFLDYATNNIYNIEPGFFALIKLCQLVSDQPFTLFLAAAALTISFFYLGLRNIQAKHPSLIYLLFLTVVFPITFNATRQGIAISIVFLALTYLIKSKNKKFILLTIFAAMFHVSALVALVAYPAFKFLMRKKDHVMPTRFLVRSVVATLMVVGLIPLIFHLVTQISIFQKYANYTDYVSGVSATMIAFKVAMIAIVTYFYKKMSAKNTYIRAYFILALIEISTISLWFSSAAIFRVSLFFTPFTLILISELPTVFKSSTDKLIVQASLVLFCALYFYVAYFVAGQAEIIPYRFIN